MKKILYLCGIMLMSLNIMAQVSIDNNYSSAPSFIDDFDETGRYWHNFKDYPKKYWRAYCAEYCPAGVTRGTHEHQVYRQQNCVFDPSNSSIKLISEYAGHRLLCGEYTIPSGYECDANHGSLFYYSGNIETRQKFQYGYFEIKCKLPYHQGSYPAFWLWGADSVLHYYEEIDIMEYDYGEKIANGASTIYSLGCLDDISGTNDITRYGNNVNLPSNNDITHWHRYGCEWLPDRITWYLDGEVVGEYINQVYIPKHPMVLKANYSISNSALCNPNQSNQYPVWVGSDEMTIDYIVVNQLKWDCSTDEVITCQSDLNSFDYKVKKSITVTSSVEDVIVYPLNVVNMRVTDSFVINGPFEVKAGGVFSVLAHDCIE